MLVAITSQEMANIVNERIGFKFYDPALYGDTTGFGFDTQYEAESYINSLVDSCKKLLMNSEFSREPVKFKETRETKTVKIALYLDTNEELHVFRMLNKE